MTARAAGSGETAIDLKNIWEVKLVTKGSESVSGSVMCDSASSWTVAHQAPLPLGFSRQEYWSELPFPSPGDLPDPGINPGSLALQANSLPSEPPGKPQIGRI